MTVIHLDIVGSCVIEVDQFRVTPASSHLFGLLLFLSLRDGRPTSRKELQALLTDSDSSAPTSHNLRQLLYRLRGLGLRFEEHPTGLILHEADVIGPLDELRKMTLRDRCHLLPPAFEVLPSYAPPLPRLFLSWVEDTKSGLEGQIRLLLLADLEVARKAHAWADVAHICVTLTVFDPANEEVISGHAEALAMMGRREEALLVLDSFVADSHRSREALAPLHSLRTRIARSTFTRREGTLRARASCLEFLEAEWERVASDGARMSALLGVAGLGKTRVAEEFALRIALRGGHVLRFECDNQSHQQPLSLFSHILPALRSMRGSLGASPEYRASLALFRPANSDTEPLIHEGMSLEARRADIQSGLVDLLEAVTSERPMLLVVDDAHLLDEASRAVLRALTTTRNGAQLQVLMCARPSWCHSSPLAPTRRSSMYELTPLSRHDSLALLLELGAGLRADEAHVEWCLAQAAGNPFYLHQLATHTPSSALPFDIASLALSAYSSLGPNSSSVLETCLLLGRFATMQRVMLVVRIDDHTMLLALRELEQAALVHFVDGHLSGPHALLHDALRALIPSTVSALLHRRIAARLEEECVADRFTPELAWASAQSWLAAGDPAAATHLLRRCAGHAAELGEPAAAADLLSQVPHSALPPRLLAQLLDDLSHFANVGGRRVVGAVSLRERLRLAHVLAEGKDRIDDLTLRLAESELLDGDSIETFSATIQRLLTDLSAAPSLRAQAGARLMVIADIDFDSQLAELVRSCLKTVDDAGTDTRAALARSELVYHTTFGDLDRARALVGELLAAFPSPDVSAASSRARTYAAFAYYRMGYSSDAVEILEHEYAFMISRRVYGEALYAASLRTDVALTIGDFDAARVWLARCDSAARGVAPHHLSPNSGFHSNAGVLAMMEGRYEEAKEHFLAPLRQDILSTRRYRAVSLALLLRLEQLRADRNLSATDVGLLRHLYDIGKCLGGQDSIVEALWCALTLNGDSPSATQLLRDYLSRYRRERTQVGWSLRSTTAADEAWSNYA